MTPERRPRIVTFTTLFPNAAQPGHGVFVENRLRHLAAAGAVELRVVAPVPWFPLPIGKYGVYARVPRRETRYGVRVDHPRYPLIPKLGMSAAAVLMYLSLKPFLARQIRDGDDFDLIDAHYFYPDGVAAVMIARALGKKVVVTGRGTDLNLIPDHALPRRQILWAASRADGVVTVSRALQDRLAALGADGARVRVLRNGVDLANFRPLDRAAARRRFGLDRRALVAVGNLVALKGHDLMIGALARLPDTELLIAGDGPERGRLDSLARELGVATRVKLLGRLPHDGLAALYSAADALVLASSREGWPNVLLEGMACGTPAVATNVGGVAEIVADPAAGVLAESRSVDGLVAAINRLFADPPQREATRAYAEGFGWDATTEGQIALFKNILNNLYLDL